MKVYDCILIHTPKFNHYFHPLGNVGFVNIIASGIFSIADILVKNQFNVKIIHMGLEKLKTDTLNVRKIISENKAKVYGLSLMWHFQLYDVIELAKTIKNIYPNSFLVVGGITASIFKYELLNKFRFIDAIIEGEGEIPMLKLVSTILTDGKNPNLDEIPNLYYNKGDSIVEPKLVLSTPQEIIDELSFMRPDLLANAELYSNLHFYTKYNSSIFTKLLNSIKLWASPLWYITIGRGCMHRCSFCAGNYNLRHVLHRKKPMVRKIENVLADIEKLQKFGVRRITSAFFYEDEEEYFLLFLKEYAKYFKHIELNFDCWGIPSKELIDEFSAIKDLSVINVVIYSLSEKVRVSNHIHKFTNDDLIEITSYAKKRDVRLKMILTSGLPFEDETSIKETLKIAKEIKRINPKNNVIIAHTELAPYSDMHLYPDKYGIRITARSFDDFFFLNKSGRFFLGYHFIGEDESMLIKRKCEHTCFIDPSYGRLICKSLNLISRYL